MENKYYTPEITEFYIGFEYEYKLNNEYYNVAFHPSDMVEYARFQKDLYYDNLIRVKYLNSSDIESLGFPLIEEKLGKQVFGNILPETIWIGLLDNNVEIIKVTPGFRDILFKGTIKNKSELKQILKMIGYYG